MRTIDVELLLFLEILLFLFIYGIPSRCFTISYPGFFDTSKELDEIWLKLVDVGDRDGL